MHRRDLVAVVVGVFGLSLSPTSGKRRKRRKKNKAKTKQCIPGPAGPCTYDQCPLFVSLRMDATLGANKGTAWGADLKRSVIQECCGAPSLLQPGSAYQPAVVACVVRRGY